jgi:hypothetical protein
VIVVLLRGAVATVSVDAARVKRVGRKAQMSQIVRNAAR